MKWTLVAFIVLVLGLLLITGCGTKEAPGSDTTPTEDLPPPPSPPPVGNESFPSTSGRPSVQEGGG